MTTTAVNSQTTQQTASSNPPTIIPLVQTPIKPISLQSNGLASPSSNTKLHTAQNLKTKSINSKSTTTNNTCITLANNNANFKPGTMSLMPSPSKAQIPIAARPLAPANLVPIAVAPMPLQVKTQAPNSQTNKKSAKIQQDTNLLVQQQQQQTRQPIQTAQPQQLTQDQLAQIAAMLSKQQQQQQQQQSGLSFGGFQLVPITTAQAQANRVAQPVIIAPMQPQIALSKNSTQTQPQQPQPQPQQQQQTKTPIYATMPDGQTVIIQATNLVQQNDPQQSYLNFFNNQTKQLPILANQTNQQTKPNLQELQQRLAEEEHRNDQLRKQLEKKTKQQQQQQLNKSPTKVESQNKSPQAKKTLLTTVQNESQEPKQMEIDHPEPQIEEQQQQQSSQQINSSLNNSQNSNNNNLKKSRGRPRLYAINPSTGKSIKGRLLNGTSVPAKPKQAAQTVLANNATILNLSNGFTIYPSPSTSTSSYTSSNPAPAAPATSNPTIIIPFNPQFNHLVQTNPEEQENSENEELEEEESIEEEEEEEEMQQEIIEEVKVQEEPTEIAEIKNSEKEETNLTVTPVPEPPQPQPTQPVLPIQRLSPNSLKSQVVLTHVIDGYVIKESSKPFPVKSNTKLTNSEETAHNTTVTSSPPKSTSTPSGLNQQLSNKKVNKNAEEDITDRLNNSKLLEETTNSLNTSNTSVKSSKSTSCHKHHHHHHHHHRKHQCPSSSSSSPKKCKSNNNKKGDNLEKVENDKAEFRLAPFSTNTTPLLDTSQFTRPPAPNLIMTVPSEQYPTGDPTEWNCEEVYRFVSQVAGVTVAEMFRSQEVDGSALNLIRDDHLVNTMQIKLGPALKIMSKFNELKQKYLKQFQANPT